MKKDAERELWQLQMALIALMGRLRKGVDHLDELTCRTIARALGEIVQEMAHMPADTPRPEIAEFAREVLVGTGAVQQELEERWREELQPLMARAEERAEELGHDLAEFNCLTVNGEKWGAICMKCLRWVTVQPGQIGGALLAECTGWAGATWRN